jgi:ligand-binding sensor domain-containing protein/DNA-binding CsgD family transcriptional regulator/membrane protein implicated in regulation of membrane protease activity
MLNKIVVQISCFLIFHYYTTTSHYKNTAILTIFLTSLVLQQSFSYIHYEFDCCMKKVLLFFLLCTSLLEILSAQNSIGLSDITNFSKSAYLAGAQNWDIKQDGNGLIYFANNEGLLVFDGSYWKLYHLPNNTIVRSIEIKGSRIYVGGQNEVGFFEADKNGRLVYTSLKPLLPENERSFPDVWNIVSYQNDIFFRASNKIMRLSGNKFSVYPNYDWRFMGVVNNKFITQDHNNRLLELVNDQWVPSINQGALPKDFLVTSIISYNNDTAIVTTLKNGIYFLANNNLSKFQTSSLDAITKKAIYTSVFIDGNRFLLATSLGGCFVVDKKGNLIQSFSTREGLQNNNVRHVFLDRNRNVWLGLDNGIDFIAYDNAIKQINPDAQNEGAGYAAIIHNNTLYIGTTNGLYSTSLDGSKNISLVKGTFKQVANSQGQVWNLSEVNGELLMGHHEGSFVIKNNTAIDFDHSAGFWNFFPLGNQPSPVMIAGNYQGVNFYNYENGKFVSHNLNVHFESSRIVAIDNGNIWVAHPYKGVFKISFTTSGIPTVQSYAVNKGLTSVNHYYVFKIKNKVIAPTESGFYEYNRQTDKFERSAFFEKLFGNVRASYLKEDANGNIWFVTEKSLGVVDFSGPQPKIIYIPELKGKIVSGFEFVYPVDINNVLVGSEKGFYHINYEQYRKNSKPIEVLIRTIKAVGETDSLIYGGYAKDNTRNNIYLNYSWNSLHFEYASTLYGQQSNLEYSYYLKGFDKNWSDWSKKTEKDYTNLPAGSYTFLVKARNNLGNESAAVSYRFSVLPPWYQSIVAYIIYIILASYLVYWIYKRQQRKFMMQQQKHEEEQKRLQYLHQLEIDRNEKEIVKLKNEKLEAEINYKNKELAGATMNLVQKGELMTKIKDELMRLLKNLGNDESTKSFKKVIKMMTEDEKFEQDWEHFSFHFDRVHGDFLTALKNKFPHITPSELKLCAYLRMNLSTKEIAQLMNISVRGVEVSRYRLRKKLQIPSEVNLFDYLMESVKDTKESIEA